MNVTMEVTVSPSSGEAPALRYPCAEGTVRCAPARLAVIPPGAIQGARARASFISTALAA